MNNLLSGGTNPQGKFVNPLFTNALQTYQSSGMSTQFFNAFLSSAIGLIFTVGSIIFFFMLVTGAIQWIMSGGDKASLEGARSRITSAIVGIIILLSTYMIAKIVETFFGISILTLDIGSLIIR